MAKSNRMSAQRPRLVSASLTASFFALVLLPGCATVGGIVGKRETEPAPPESRFVRVEIPVPGTDRSYPVWRTRSSGRPILLFHAVNGLNPDLLRFALELESWGYRAYLPSLYGDPIEGDPAYGYNKELTSIRVIRRSGVWNPVSTETVGLIAEDAAAMARWVSRAEGGRSIAVIGNSITGSFPLPLLAEPCVGLAVLGQPAVPARRMHEVLLRLPQSPEKRRALTLTEEKWSAAVRGMRRSPGKRIVGFHYLEDPMGSIERFDELHERLSRAGLAQRFTAYVMTPPGHPYAAERKSWVVARETSERPKMVTPHSTFLDGGNEEDLKWFRGHLRKTLARGW